MDAAAQLILEKLDAKVSEICPSMAVIVGRNSSGAWDLFTYRVYRSTGHPEIDPVVVGIQCAENSAGFDLRGAAPGTRLIPNLASRRGYRAFLGIHLLAVLRGHVT